VEDYKDATRPVASFRFSVGVSPRAGASLAPSGSVFPEGNTPEERFAAFWLAGGGKLPGNIGIEPGNRRTLRGGFPSSDSGFRVVRRYHWNQTALWWFRVAGHSRVQL